eukprot:9466697-Pyramimonas_sp.AAC.1
MLQSAHADLAKATRENFESIRLIQEQVLQQAIQDREIAEGRSMEDVKGMIQVMKDEIAEMNGEYGRELARWSRHSRREIHSTSRRSR